MMTGIRLHFLVFVSLVFCSCSSDGDGASNIDLLTRQNWILSDARVNPPIVQNSQSIENIYNSPLLPECVKSKKLTIHSDGTFQILHGSEECSGTSDLTVKGTWEFSLDEKTILLNQDTDSLLTLNILELNKQQFRFSVMGSLNHVFNANLDNDSTAYTFVIEYSH